MEEIRKEKYIFYEELGSGGSGKVYRAYDKHLRCDRAVKKFLGKEQIWKKELDMLKELRHPLLPVITDVMEEGEDRYLVMEYIEGRNLEEYIKGKGRVEQEQAVRWALELADVLIYLHERKNPIIYRDMKPANIMVENSGKLRLVDFGTAWLPYGEGDGAAGAGTYGYAAPEQISGGLGMADERSDIYGLGATLYHMLTGDDPSRPPYLIQPIRFFDRRLSVELERIVKKAVAEEKEKRYQTVRQFQAALREYKNVDRIKRRIGGITEILYYGILFGLSAVFARRSGQPGRERDVFITAVLILALCLIKSAAGAWRRRGRRGMRQERNILLSEKRGRGLLLALLVGFCTFFAAGSAQASAGEEKVLQVEVRNEWGQKLLIRYDAIYQLKDVLKLELPLNNFEEGQIYRLQLECINCGTEERSSRTFYLKSIGPES